MQIFSVASAVAELLGNFKIFCQEKSGSNAATWRLKLAVYFPSLQVCRNQIIMYLGGDIAPSSHQSILIEFSLAGKPAR